MSGDRVRWFDNPANARAAQAKRAALAKSKTKAGRGGVCRAPVVREGVMNCDSKRSLMMRFRRDLAAIQGVPEAELSYGPGWDALGGPPIREPQP